MPCDPQALAYLNRAREHALAAIAQYERKKEQFYTEYMGIPGDVMEWEREAIEKHTFRRFRLEILSVTHGKRLGGYTYLIQGRHQRIRAFLPRKSRLFASYEVVEEGESTPKETAWAPRS